MEAKSDHMMVDIELHAPSKPFPRRLPHDMQSSTHEQGATSVRNTWPRCMASRLARRQRNAIRRITTYLWVLAGAILYHVAAADSHRASLAGVGFAIIALTFVVGIIARRRLLASMTLWHLREGCSPSEAHRRAKLEVARVWNADRD